MINIAEILKDAPQGLKLYSLVHGEVTLNEIILNNEYPVRTICSIGSPSTFTKHGKFIKDLEEDAECVLYPSKEHKSWDNWQEVLFQIGDIVTNNITHRSFIITNYNTHELIDRQGSTYHNKFVDYEYATPEEREQFFKELNANSYYWNENTKQIEKSLQDTFKYKVGDWIKRLTPDNKEKKYFLLKVTGINDVSYQLENIYGNRYYKEKTFVEDETFWKPATEQELINANIKEKQFTVNSLKPFDKVLVRNYDDTKWVIDLFAFYDYSDRTYIVAGGFKCRYCIPYNDETKHLLGTTDDCPDKYKTW